MRKFLLSLVILLFSVGAAQAQAICGGQTVALQAQNPQNLSNPSYSMNPGGATDQNGLFVFSPSVTSTYTLYTSGTNTNNTFTTTTAVHQVTVHPQPNSVPTVTNFACNTTTNCWNLNLTFNPPTSPQFTITWAAPNPTTTPNIPPNWTNPQTGQCGTLAPSSYTAMITAEGGCSDTVTFALTPPVAPAEFSLSPSPNYVLTCNTHTIDIAASNTALTYTYNNNNVQPIASPSISVTFSNVGTWTVVGVNPTSGCVKTITFAVTQNTQAPVSTVSPTFQNITCTSVPQTITLTAVSPTVNFTHFIYSPVQSTFVANNQVDVYQPGPGTYTYVFYNNATGCFSTKQFTVASSSGFPTFGVQSSPGGFTLGCSSKSLATITFTNAQTTPTPGGSVSYTLLAPGMSSATPSGSLSTNQTYSITAPGSYTAIVKDNSNGCENRQPFSVTTNTFPPSLDSVLVPKQILDCNNISTIIESFASDREGGSNVNYNWSFPTQAGVGNLASSSYTVNINTFVPPTTTLIATYTLTVQENNNLCITRTFVPIYQNLFPPQAFATASSPSITCDVTKIVLTNFSSSRVPVGGIFTTGQPVEAILWKGPSPQVDLQNSTTYTALIAGQYTMTARDINNGCTSETIVVVYDGVEYPLVTNSYSMFPLDCGSDNVRIYPTISTSTTNLSYTWTAPPQRTISPPPFTRTLTTFDDGTYTVTIKNNINGCIKSDSLQVVTGTLTPAIEAGPTTGYAPLRVRFTNNSTSKLGNSGIETVWSFGMDSVLTTPSATIIPEMVFNQPGTYTITAFVRKGECLDTAYAVVMVDIPSQLVIPNVFSPNGDGVNDLFFLQRSANISEITAKIYDRWGNLVYEVTSNTGNIEWNGVNQLGKESPSGAYFYIITAQGKDGQSYDEKGHLTLLR